MYYRATGRSCLGKDREANARPGKQGSEKKDWGRSGDLEIHIYMCVSICVCMGA